MNTGPALIECINRYDRIYLKGEPGSGKTTFLKHIVLQYAEGEAPEKSGFRESSLPFRPACGVREGVRQRIDPESAGVRGGPGRPVITATASTRSWRVNCVAAM